MYHVIVYRIVCNVFYIAKKQICFASLFILRMGERELYPVFDTSIRLVQCKYEMALDTVRYME